MVEIKVPNMNCIGCVNLIDKQLSTKLTNYEIILEEKIVKVEEANFKMAKKLIKKAGFTVR